ncbi:MAG: lysophospholipid acyltransferase family protein [Gaiellaceae bacterium]
MILYRALDAVGFRPFLRAALRMEIEGREHVPSTGPVLLAANHESIWDPFVLGVLTTRPIRYMAKAELWRYPVLRTAMEAFGTFPVERGNGDTAALSRAVRLLEEGEAIGVFPQGTSKQSHPRRYHRGVARLALLTGAPIVPVRLVGTRGILRPGLPMVRIVTRPPIRVEPARPTVAAAKALTARLEEAIAA